MNKNTVIALVLVVVLVGAGIILSRSNRQDLETVELPLVDEMVTENQDAMMLESGVYNVVVDQSQLNWKGKKILVNSSHVGVIPVKSGSVTISENNFVNAEVVFDVLNLSVDEADSGKAKLEEHLKSKDFIDTEKYPEAKFVLTSATSTGENKFDLVGSLEMNGAVNEITIPAQLVPTDMGLKLAGAVNIDRTLWNINFGSGKVFDNLGDAVIDDTVEISFDLLMSLPAVEAMPAELETGTAPSLMQ